MRNVFESNESKPQQGVNEDKVKEVLQSFGFDESVAGQVAAKLQERGLIAKVAKRNNPPRNPEICNCGKYQTCDKCKMFQHRD